MNSLTVAASEVPAASFPAPFQMLGGLPVMLGIGDVEFGEGELAQDRDHRNRVGLLVGLRKQQPHIGVTHLQALRQ